MQKAEPQHGQKQNQPAAKQGGTASVESPQGEQIAQLEAMMDSSPQAQKLAGLAAMMNNSPAMAAQRKLIAMIDNSPRQVAQRKLFDSIHNSPLQTAQRKKFDKLFGTAQRVGDEEPLQPKLASASPAQLEQQPAPTPNNTGLPDNLKNGIENLSGISMDSVKVHYNSSQPAQLNALAYAQGTDIHVAPGQEQHLPHEAWHVVQQAQGRVQPTMQMKNGVPVNDDKGLEHEADVMGGRALDAEREVTPRDGSKNTGVLRLTPSSQPNAPFAAQRTIFHMGDDTELATRDGASLGKKLKHEYIEIPIPTLTAADGILAKASNPFVVMFHGSTLRRLGATRFQDTLIEKGYPRSKGLELVLITCSADIILGKEDAQMLANTLQSKVRAAKGNVVVRPDGVPHVHVKRKDMPDLVHTHDIFELMGTFFEDFAAGWSLYTPQPDQTLGIIKRDARRQVYLAEPILDTMSNLMQAKDKAEDPGAVGELHERVKGLMVRVKKNFDDANQMQGQATNEGLLTYRATVDNMLPAIEWIAAEVKEMEAEWEARNGQSVGLYLFHLKLGNLVEDVEPAGGGWDIDFDLDGLGEEKDNQSRDPEPTTPVGNGVATQSSQEEVHSLKAKQEASHPSAKVLQRVMISPGEPLPDGRGLDELTTSFNDIGLAIGNEMTLRIDFGALEDSKCAVTRLLMNNVASIPFDVLTIGNANKNFTIEIILSEAMFEGGKKKLPELISTLTHEWELHGRQFALNISKIKNAQVPDSYFGHGHFFTPKIQGFDRAMARGIDDAREDDKALILTDYLGDAKAHEQFVAEGWTEEGNEKAQQLHKAILDMKGSWNILRGIHPSELQEPYEKLILGFMSEFSNPYFDEPQKDVTAGGLQFFFQDPYSVYTQMIAAFASTIPNDYELYAVSRLDFKRSIRSVLLDWLGFMDVCNMLDHAKDTPRLKAMEQLGHRLR